MVVELLGCASEAGRVLRCANERVREEGERVGYWVARKGWGGDGRGIGVRRGQPVDGGFKARVSTHQRTQQMSCLVKMD
jgi:hypothetical protein